MSILLDFTFRVWMQNRWLVCLCMCSRKGDAKSCQHWQGSHRWVRKCGGQRGGLGSFAVLLAEALLVFEMAICNIVPPFELWNAQMHKCTNAQNTQNAQMHKCSKAQRHKCTNAQMHKCTNAHNAQMHKCTTAIVTKTTHSASVCEC